MAKRFEQMTYLERAELYQADPETYRAMKRDFEARAAAEIRRGILTRAHRAWLANETRKQEHERLALMLNSELESE